MPNVTVGSFSLGAGPLISGDCPGWLLIILLLSHRPQSEATPRADPAKPAMKRRKAVNILVIHVNYTCCSSISGYLRLFSECLSRLVRLSLQWKAKCKDWSQWHTLIFSFCLCLGYGFAKGWLLANILFNINCGLVLCPRMPDLAGSGLNALFWCLGHTEGRHQALQHQHVTRL